MSEQGTTPRLVIAEDFVLIQENIRRLITQDCNVVAAVDDGQAALDAVANHVPDILLLDISLPDISGFAVAERLQQTHPSVRIIFLTAHREKSFMDRAFEIGAKGYVLKSSMRTELRVAIRAVAGGGSYRSPLLV